MDRRQLMGRSLAGAAGVWTWGSGAQAATPARPARQCVVEAVQMPAWSERDDGRRQPLAAGDGVSTAQVVETAARAGLVLLMPEGSRINLGEKTRLGIERLMVDTPDGRIAVRSELRLFEGFFRFATSAVARVVGQRDVNLSLRTTTVGIRGTDFWSMTDAAHDAVCLFEGRVELATRDQGTLALAQPGAFWSRFFEQPAQPVGTATPEQLAKFIASSAIQPGQGVAVLGGSWHVTALVSADARAAIGLAGRLRQAGYPALLRSAGSRHEVRIAQLATREDAQAVLERVQALSGNAGSVAQGR
jgi:hypothetical protein